LPVLLLKKTLSSLIIPANAVVPKLWYAKAFKVVRETLLFFYTMGGQQVDRDRPVDRRVSIGRSCLILHWIDKISKKNIFQSIFQKVHKNYCSRW